MSESEAPSVPGPRLYDSKRFIACVYRRGEAPADVEAAIADDKGGDFVVVVREDAERDVIGCAPTLEEASSIAERFDEAQSEP